jgi:tetratricopeptide (TPR) repeat protein
MTTDPLRRVALCLALFGLLAAPAKSQSQGEAKGRLVPPLKPGLLPVHTPDLRGLEAEIREQLSSLQDALAALAKEPDLKLSEAYSLLGQAYHAYALTAPARECYSNAQRLAPKDFRWPYLLGHLCQQEGRAEEAITHYKLARQLRPDYLPAPVQLGNLYLQQNRLAEARASFNEALALNAQCTAARYGLGQLALAQRSYAEAAQYLEQALAEAPEANRIHYALALAYRGLGKLEQAQAELQRQGTVGVRVTDPLVEGLQELVRGERLHLLRGRVAFDARRFAEAAEAFRKAITANPASTQAHINLGAALVELGERAGALEQYQAALRLDPGNATAHYNLGLLLAKQNQHEEAINHLQAALSAQPKDADARLLLAQELLRAARREEALAEFSRLVEANPDNEDALLEQVKLLLQNKQYKQTRASLEQAHARFPQKGRSAALLAYLLAASPQLELRDGARALVLAKLVFESTGLVNHGIIVALALAELGRCDEAAEWQRRLLAAAERERKTELAGKLKADLQRYEQGPSCRPQGELAGLEPTLQSEKKSP